MDAAATIARLAASAERAAARSEPRGMRAEDAYARRDNLHRAAAVLPERDPERARFMARAEMWNLKGCILAALSEGEPRAARKWLHLLRIARGVTKGVVA